MQTVEQRAKRDGVDHRTILRRIERGEIPAVVLPGGSWLTADAWADVRALEAALGYEVDVPRRIEA
jgi:predicted site-specific integrase-resolvase